MSHSDGRSAYDVPATRRKADMARAGRTLKILVVDDNRMMLETIDNILDCLGHVAIVAESANDALSRLDEHPDIDAMICDVELSINSNGLDLAVRVQQDYPELKILFVSGRWTGDLTARLPNESVLLSKPFQKRDLDQCLGRLFRDS